MSNTKYFVDENGLYLGGYAGVDAPENAVEVPRAPSDARQKWDGQKWLDIPVDGRLLRDQQLEALVHDFGDGRIIQVRPKDEPNFERAYKLFAMTDIATIDWVMVDNVKHPITEAELRTAHDVGVLAGAAIWDAYEP